MPVEERVTALGQWSVKLRADTPYTVRAAIATPFGHIVITPTRALTTTWSDAQYLAHARYLGVCVAPGPQFELRGFGLSWWLGANGQGQVLVDPIEATDTFENWVDSVLSNMYRADILAGDIEVAGGSHYGNYQWVSARDAIDAICDWAGREWRVNNDFTLDAGSVSHLYGSAAVPVVVRRGGGSDPTARGFEAEVGLRSDYEEYANQVVMLAREGMWAGSSSETLRNGLGVLTSRTRLVEASNIPPGSASSAGTNLLAETTAARQEVTVTTDRYDVGGVVTVGGYVDIFDPTFGLNGSYERRYQGQTIRCTRLRLLGLTWPIERGMGVYYRTATGVGTFTYTDLTPYVEWESGATTLDVGWRPRSLLGRLTEVDELARRTQAAAWDKWTLTPTSAGPSFMTSSAETLSFAFRLEGSAVHLRGVWTVNGGGGATSIPVGTGAFRFPLPSGLVGAAVAQSGGSALATRSATGDEYRGMCHLDASGTYLEFGFGDGTPTATRAADTVPHTWGSNDTLEFSVTIQVAF